MKHLKTHEGFKDWFKKKPKDEPTVDIKKDDKKPEVKKDPADIPTFNLLDDIMSKVKSSDFTDVKSITELDISKNEWLNRYRQSKSSQIYCIKISDVLKDRVVDEVRDYPPGIKKKLKSIIDTIDLIMICSLTDDKGVYSIRYTYLHSFKDIPENPIGYLSIEQEEYVTSQMNEAAAKKKTYRYWASHADFATIGDNTIGVNPDNFITEYPQISYSHEPSTADLNDITKDNMHRTGIDKIKYDISQRVTSNEVAYQTSQIGGIMNELDTQYRFNKRRKKLKENLDDIKTIFYDISDISECNVELLDDNSIAIYIKSDGISVISQSKSGRTSSSGYNRSWTANFNEAHFKLTDKLMKIFELLQEAKPRIKDIVPDCEFDVKLEDDVMHINVH